MQENNLLSNKHILLCIENDTEVMDYLKQHFCGIVINDFVKLNQLNAPNLLVYIYGNIQQTLNQINNKDGKLFCVIEELSYNYDEDSIIRLVTLGEVPINVNNVGVFFRNFFSNKNYFDCITKEHQFQSLTESNKPGISYRKGIYLTNVEQINDQVNFNLLRCSTNLDGPTDNFRENDHEIINKVNDISQYFFEQKANLNHVLAQVYNNTKYEGKDRKAKIKEHSDKTKDMPRNGLIAFCTFYHFDDVNLKEISRPENDNYDYCYKHATILTKLRFRLKNCVNDSRLLKQFDIILYPNSVFIMSLLMNRYYTHEIVPSKLSIDKLPTRLGYVIRCSKTEAVYKNNQTYIRDQNNDDWIQLQEPTVDQITELKDMYYKENTTADLIEYGQINFSLNKGDYIKAII